VAGSKIGADDFDVAVFEDVADVPAFRVLHARSLYVTRKSMPLLIPCLVMLRRQKYFCKDVATGRGGSRHAVTRHDWSIKDQREPLDP
jgi:hypothetical protein